MTTQTEQVIPARKKLTDILAQVSVETGLEATDIIGPVKRALYFQARCLFARRATAEGYVARDIAEALGRCRTAVVHYLEQEGGEEDVNKDEARKGIKGLNKEERKELVKIIAEESERGDRDHLAAIFSGAQGASAADVAAHGASGEAPRKVPEPEKKEKSWLDEI